MLQIDKSKMNNYFLQLYCDQVKYATEGYAVDLHAILNVFQNITPDNVDDLVKAFYSCYQRSILTLLKQNTAGKQDQLLSNFLQSRYQLWARLIKKTIKGLGTDERVLTELIMLATEEDLNCIQETYQQIFDIEMLDDISADFGKSTLLKLLKGWVYSTRYERKNFLQDAEALSVVLKDKKPDEQTVVRLLTTTTRAEFVEINKSFKILTGKNILEALHGRMGKSQYAVDLAFHTLHGIDSGIAFVLSQDAKGKKSSLLWLVPLLRDRFTASIQTQFKVLTGRTLLQDLQKDFGDLGDQMYVFFKE
uniref:Annexin 1 n=1 Tax=Spironucleus barkhanus TaxID=103874 RepID=A0A142C653_SPIBA|nr:annexin 1 [Spironucleus barkhanus]